MPRYLLDTTALVDTSRRRQPAADRLRTLVTLEDQVGVCSITVGEFFAGLSPQLRDEWWGRLARLHFWDASRESAERAGAWRDDYARRGIILSLTDTLVAAIAYEAGAAVVTSNVRDFPMPEVRVIGI